MKPTIQEIVAYEYSGTVTPVLPAWVNDDGADSEEQDPQAEPHVSAQDLERRITQEAQKCFEAGRVRGAEEARTAIAREADERLHHELEGIIRSFAAERDRYLQAVEREVVKLALAIAARILWREAEMDPLLLTGAVRVALGQLAASTRIKLRVPAAQTDLWNQAMALLPNIGEQTEIIADQNLQAGDCIVETDLGQVDLGMRAQLCEIERGFFESPFSSVPASGHQP